MCGPTDSDGKMLGTSEGSFCSLSKLWYKSPQTEFPGRGYDRFFELKSSSEGAEIPGMIDLLAIGTKGCLSTDHRSGGAGLGLGPYWPQHSAYAGVVREVFPAYELNGMVVLWVDHGRIGLVDLAFARVRSHQGDAL